MVEVLDVIVPYTNPLHWDNRRDLMLCAEAHIVKSGARLTTVECSYDGSFDLPYLRGINRVRVHARRPLWIKECLINIGLRWLSGAAHLDVAKVGWLDGDVAFVDLDWVTRTIAALDECDVVQPWSHAHDLDRNSDTMHVHTSLAFVHSRGEPIAHRWRERGTGNPLPHPGYAWAARRDFLDRTGGLLETAILGSADSYMAYALLGRVLDAVPDGLSPGYLVSLERWQERTAGSTLGCVPGTIEHGWHGPKSARGYTSRNDCLIEHQFNPATDLRRNAYGVVQLAVGNPLQEAIDRYFLSRREDATE